MTDKDLAVYGERLWTAIIATELAPIEIGGLTAALRARTPWSEMGPGLKLALFRIARNAPPPEASPEPVDAPVEAEAAGEPAADDGPPFHDRAAPDMASAADRPDDKDPTADPVTEAEAGESKT